MSKLPSKFFSISKGAMVRVGSEVFEIEGATTVDSVLVRNVADKSYKTLLVTELAAIEDGGTAERTTPELVADALDYGIAQARLAAIAPLIKNPFRRRADVERVAKSLEKSPATIYNWIRTYEDSPQISSLIPIARGPDKGSNRLDARMDAIISDAVAKHLKTPQRKRVTVVFNVVKDACRVAGLQTPHSNTVRNRVRAIPRAALLRSQGRSDEALKFEPVLGFYREAIAPLSVVQMDHVQADVEIVDDFLRLALGRPWVTVAIDVHTRMIVGIVISLERPSAFTAGLCIGNAMLPKDDYLRKINVIGSWPIWGKPGIVHMDNAKEFKGELLQNAFAEYNIDLRLRKVKTPNYGGHIERFMRTFNDALRTLPGATFSNPEERRGYNSSTHAAMTLAEFETWVVDFIINIYHQQPHAGLMRRTPEAKWHEGVVGNDQTPGIGIPPPPRNPERLRLDFLPFEKRTVGRRGILLDYLHYWHDGLRKRIHEPDPNHAKIKRKFLLRVDPRDITRIWFYDPDAQDYILTQTLDTTRPPISKWEWKALLKYLHAQGESDVNEQKLFDARARLRAAVEVSNKATKAARLAQQRAANAEKHSSETTEKLLPRASSTADHSVKQPAATIKPYPNKLFDEEILPFEDIDP